MFLRRCLGLFETVIKSQSVLFNLTYFAPNIKNIAELEGRYKEAAEISKVTQICQLLKVYINKRYYSEEI